MEKNEKKTKSSQLKEKLAQHARKETMEKNGKAFTASLGEPVTKEQLEAYIKADCRAAIYFLNYLNSRPEILSAIAEMMQSEQKQKQL